MSVPNLYIHFDYVVTVNNRLHLGVILTDGEDGELLSSSMKEFDVSQRQGNNFHYTLSAFGYAFTYVKEFLEEDDLVDAFETLTFCNQNHHIFTWFKTAEYDANKYQKAMKNVFQSFKNLLELFDDNDVDFVFSTIKGKKNAAKLALKNHPAIEQMPHKALLNKQKENINSFSSMPETTIFFTDDPFDFSQEPAPESIDDLIKDLNSL